MHRFPFLLVPLIAYNAIVFGIVGTLDTDPWRGRLFDVSMISGAEFSLTAGAALVLVALVCLFFEMLKSTRVGMGAVWDHMLSTFVFVAFLVEFLLVPAAATSTFAVLLAISLLDLLAGFAVSLRSARRDVTVGDEY